MPMRGTYLQGVEMGEVGRLPNGVGASMGTKNYYLAKEIFTELFWVILKPFGHHGRASTASHCQLLQR